MRKQKPYLSILLSLCLLLFLAVPVQGAQEESGYRYTVRFFAGKQGTLGGEEMLVMTDLAYGSRISFSQNMVTLNDGSKYYVKGIRESGEDNSTAQENSFRVTCDADYVVAYGILGDAVAYTVNYEDTSGNALAPSETYYGNVGDKPVIAYLYIEGYRPQAYNLTKTLSENAEENVFTFVYALDAEGEGETATTPTGATAGATSDETGTGATEAGTAAGAGTGTGATEAGTGAGAADADGDTADGGDGAQDLETIPDEETPLGETENLMDLDEEETPLGSLGLLDSDAKLLGIPLPVVLVSGLILIGSAVGFFVVYKKRRKSNYDQ